MSDLTQVISDDDFKRAMSSICRCGNAKSQYAMFCSDCTIEFAGKTQEHKEAWARGDNPWRPRAVDR